MNVFTYKNYKAAIRDYLTIRKTIDKGISLGKMSEKTGIQRSYLSNVFADRAELNADQLYQVAQFLNFSEAQIEFLILLRDIELSNVEDRKVKLLAKKKSIQQSQDVSETYLERVAISVNTEAYTEYFSTPNCPIVHMFLTIPKYAKRPDLICDEINLSPENLRAALITLEKCEIIILTKEQYEVKEFNMHLSDKTYLSRTYASAFRAKAIDYQQRRDNPNDYFFTSSFSANEQTRQEIHQKWMEFLNWLSKKVEKAPSSEVFHINFDLFKF